jgi:tetratricopeptide (TPR) repeat protein
MNEEPIVPFRWSGRLVRSVFILGIIVLSCPGSLLSAESPEIALPASGASDRIPSSGDHSLFLELQKVKESNGSTSDAREIFEKLRREHPGSILIPQAALLMGEMLVKKNLNVRHESDTSKLLVREASEDLWMARTDLPPGPLRDEATYAIARLLFSQGLYPEARGMVELGLRESPDGPFAIPQELLLSSCWRRSGNPRKAMDVLSRLGANIESASDVRKTDKIDYLYESGGVSLDLGRLADAGEYYRAAIALAPDYAYAHPKRLYDLGLYSDRIGHERRAFKLFREYLRRKPGGVHVPMASYRMAEISGRLGRPESRKARLMEVMRTYPHTEAADLSRITLLEDKLKSLERESPPSGRLKSLPPHQKSLDDRLIEDSGQIVRSGVTSRSRVDAASIMVPLLVSQRRYDLAFKIIHRLEIDADPQSSSGKRLLGLESAVLTRQILEMTSPSDDRKVLRLVHSYRSLVSPVLLDPRPTLMEIKEFSREGEVFLRIARAHEGIRDDAGARKWLHQVLMHGGIVPRSGALKDLISLDMKSDDTLEAWKRGQDLIALIHPGNAEEAGWILEEEKVARKLGDMDREIPLLRTFVKDFSADPRAGLAQARLFRIHLLKNEFDQAENSARKALVLLAPGGSDQESFLTLLYRFGQLEVALHRTKEAISLWEKFLRDGPTDPRRGWVMYQIGKLDEADGKNRRAYRWYIRAAKVATSPELASVARQKAQGISNLFDGRVGS